MKQLHTDQTSFTRPFSRACTQPSIYFLLFRFEDACLRLKDKEVGAYIVKQDTVKFDAHAITAKVQGRQRPCTIPFHSNGSGRIIVEVKGKEIEFTSFEDLLKHYKLTERLRPNEGTLVF